LAHLPDSEFVQAIDEISLRYETDFVLQLVLSIDDEKIESGWVLPNYKRLRKRINLDALDARKFFEKLGLKKGENTVSWEKYFSGDGRFFDVLRFLYEFQPTHDDVAGAVHFLESEPTFGFLDLPGVDVNGKDTHPLMDDFSNHKKLYVRLRKKYERRLEERRVLFKRKID
jgi:hypothetical protein